LQGGAFSRRKNVKASNSDRAQHARLEVAHACLELGFQIAQKQLRLYRRSRQLLVLFVCNVVRVFLALHCTLWQQLLLPAHC
jgi:hypothetical protein